jgi:hypothetical protein
MTGESFYSDCTVRTHLGAISATEALGHVCNGYGLVSFYVYPGFVNLENVRGACHGAHSATFASLYSDENESSCSGHFRLHCMVTRYIRFFGVGGFLSLCVFYYNK